MSFLPVFVASGFWESERARLVTLCAHLSGSRAAADDLAQETLLEAWRHQDRLTDPAGGSRWLTAIARNVCLRWRHRQRQDWQHTYQPTMTSAADDPAWEDLIADPLDMFAELDQHEMRQVVARAVRHLPPPTRRALVAHVVDDAPYGAIARELGLAEDTVRVQVHRAKRSVRHVLTTTLRAEAQACGLLPASRSMWDDTTLWCPLCGEHHLQGRWDTTSGDFALRCPACDSATGKYCAYTRADLFGGVVSLKAAFNRVMRWANAYYRPALEGKDIRCDCGARVAIDLALPAELRAKQKNERGLHARCPTCGSLGSMRLSNLALYTPEAWEFWRAHPRLCLLPERAIAFAGQPALVISYRSIADSCQIDIITAQDTYQVLDIQAGGTSYAIRSLV